jgi:hypothetical protein
MGPGMQQVISVRWKGKEWDYLYDGRGEHLKDASWSGIIHAWRDYDVLAILKK